MGTGNIYEEFFFSKCPNSEKITIEIISRLFLTLKRYRQDASSSGLKLKWTIRDGNQTHNLKIDSQILYHCVNSAAHWISSLTSTSRVPIMLSGIPRTHQACQNNNNVMLMSVITLAYLHNESTIFGWQWPSFLAEYALKVRKSIYMFYLPYPRDTHRSRHDTVSTKQEYFRILSEDIF